MIMEFAFADSFACNPAYMVCVDFNGRTAYAYLCKDRRVVSEVWLYNAVASPEKPEWCGDSNPMPPYLNPREFIREETFVIPESRERIEICWFLLDGEIQALIYIHDELHATMLEGARVGCCRLAKKDGPLARKLADRVYA